MNSKNNNRIKTDKTLFSFIHATDLHYETTHERKVPEANDRIECLIKDINAMNRNESLSFIFLSGDLSDRGAANKDDLIAAKKVYDTFDIPYYPVAGNHDLAPNRRFAEMYPGKEDYHEGTAATSNYGKVFGNKGLKFSFKKCGYQFIGVSLRDGDPDGAVDWLEQEIDKATDKIIIVTHYGLYPPRDAGSLSSWGFARIGKIVPRLQSILINAAPKIIAYLYGHNHINSAVKINGTYHISGGGIQKGCTGYRLFKCFENRMESSFYLISDKSLHDFNYHGILKPENCIDPLHTTVEEYHRGSIQEQSFSIAT